MAPQLPPDQISRLLRDPADVRGQCSKGCGAGLLDARAAVIATAAQAGCRPKCGLHEERVSHRCIAFAPLEVPTGGGCHATGTADATAPWGLVLLAAILGRRRRLGNFAHELSTPGNNQGGNRSPFSTTADVLPQRSRQVCTWP